MKRKLLSVILCLCILAAIFPVSALAYIDKNGEEPPDEEGVEEGYPDEEGVEEGYPAAAPVVVDFDGTSFDWYLYGSPARKFGGVLFLDGWTPDGGVFAGGEVQLLDGDSSDLINGQLGKDKDGATGLVITRIDSENGLLQPIGLGGTVQFDGDVIPITVGNTDLTEQTKGNKNPDNSIMNTTSSPSGNFSTPTGSGVADCTLLDKTGKMILPYPQQPAVSIGTNTETGKTMLQFSLPKELVDSAYGILVTSSSDKD